MIYKENLSLVAVGVVVCSVKSKFTTVRGKRY